MKKMLFNNLVPLCFGLLAILLTSLSQAASQYKSIPELIEDQRKVPLYNEPITDSASGEKLFNFIEKNFGKTVQLDIKINIKNEGSNQFIEVNFGKESYLLVINKNEECVRDAAEIEANSTDEESMPLVTACGGTEYNFSGKGYEFNKKIDGSYILRGYFKVPEDGGGVHQGIYSIGLEAINK